MRTELRDLIERSTKIASVADVHDLCSAICHAYDMEHFIYGARFPESLTKPFVLVISGYPESWQERYASNNYLTIDPTVRHSMSHIRPLFWSELLAQEKTDVKIRTFMNEARDCGLVSGLSIPIHGAKGEVGMLSVSTDAKVEHGEAHMQSVLPQIHLLTTYVHDAVCRLVEDGCFSYKPEQLTKREMECLLWIAEGKTSWEAAQILRIAERTVIFHLQNVAKKLGVSSRQQAVARAVAQGLITPQI